MIRPKLTPVVAVLAAALFAPAAAPAQAADPDRATVFGVRLRLGARHDDVRMCVATPAGVKGGFAADVSLFADLPIGDRASVDLNLPVVRPILFAAAFRMLQLEPEATLLFRGEASDGLDFVGGPSLGLSLHYGPDYNSSPSARGGRRTPASSRLAASLARSLLARSDASRSASAWNGTKPCAAKCSAVMAPTERSPSSSASSVAWSEAMAR